ncbi:MAG: dienelactone hydrolase family protein [Polyangiaceae bacterium]
MHSITTEWVTVEVSDGTKMEAYVARPEGAEARPGLLVLQEIFGVNAHIRDIAERYAREGYVAFAPDIFHRFAPRYEGTYDDIPASIALTSNLTPDGVGADLIAAHKHLAGMAGVKKESIGAIGYCMGGRLSYVTNALVPLAAAVSYYGGGIQTQLDLAAKLAGPMLFFWAGKDGYIPTEAHQSVTAALRAADKPFTSIEFSWADHGFFCDARSNYNAQAAAQAWPLTLAFLKEHLR